MKLFSIKATRTIVQDAVFEVEADNEDIAMGAVIGGQAIQKYTIKNSSNIVIKTWEYCGDINKST